MTRQNPTQNPADSKTDAKKESSGLQKVSVTLTETRGEPSQRKSSKGVVTLLRVHERDRLRRAIRIGGIGFGLCLFSVFLPILHFVLVPGLLVGSVVVAFWTYAQSGWIMGGEGTCPACSQPFRIAKDRERWPIQDRCEKCFNDVVITSDDTPGDPA